jgi:predicted RNA-binding Zn ribbon-like protein
MILPVTIITKKEVTCQVDFANYTSLSVRFAVDLVNTLHPATNHDALKTKEDLLSFLTEHEEVVTISAQEARADTQAVTNLYRGAVHNWQITEDDVAQVRAVRGPLRTVFERASSDQQGIAALLNEQLRLYGATPRISWHHGPLHLHFESVEDGVAHWLAVTTLMGLVVVLCDYGADRFGICASESCRSAFIDTSKNTRKRYCSLACAHRESVAAFRARRRSSSEA